MKGRANVSHDGAWWPLKFGAFHPPHKVGAIRGGNVTRLLEEDLEMIELMDRLGYDEIWIGEHHTGGVELAAPPDTMIWAAVQRTSRIHIGAGVVSLPYHHPWNVANRMVMLDHLSRGRVM